MIERRAAQVRHVLQSAGKGDDTMKFTKTALIASAAAMSLGLAACDGPQEEVMEDQAEEMETAMENEADAMEDAGMEAEADAMNEAADDVEDQMEEQADEMDGM